MQVSVAIVTMLMMTLSANAQKLLFEGQYHYNGQNIDLATNQITYSDVKTNVYVYVYDTQMVVRRINGTSTLNFYGYQQNLRCYGDNKGYYVVDPNTHAIGYVLILTFWGQTTTTLMRMDPGTAPVSTGPTGPVEAPICRQCKGAGYYIRNGHTQKCGRCGGLGRDWNS